MSKKNLKIKVGVVIPTCSEERKPFVDFLEDRLQRQTYVPDLILKIDYPNNAKDPDITKRYKEGVKKAFDQGCNLVLFMEDDDYYPLTYVEEMLDAWLIQNKPILLGHDETIYYHLFNKGYKFHRKTLKHSSAFCTAVAPGIDLNVCNDNIPFFDLHLWEKNKGSKIHLQHPPIGIKHGIGKSGGSYHNQGKSFDGYDGEDYQFLKSVIDQEAFDFYQTIINQNKKLIK